MAKVRKKQIRLVVSEDEYEMFKKIAKDHKTSLAQVCRTLISQVHDKDINDTAKAIENLRVTQDKRMLEFAKSQDIATSFLINNMCEFYETKLEKLQEKVDAMVPYYQEALHVFAMHEAKKRKKRAANKQKKT